MADVAATVAAINALKSGESDEARAERLVAPRGLSPEEADIRDQVLALKSRTQRQRSRDSRAAGSKPMGVYPDTAGALLTSALAQPAKKRANPSEAVFTSDDAFDKVVEATAAGTGRFQSVHHWNPPKKSAPYLKKVRELETSHSMPHNLMAALVTRESQWDPEAESKAGAKGLTQLMPIHKIDTTDTDASLEYGAKYLAKMKKRFGTWELALAAYNWGPGNLSKYGIEKAPKETRNYVKKIMGNIHVEKD